MERVAFLFPGQGSQYVGMGKDLYESFPQAKYIFDTAEEILGWKIRKICFEGPEEELKKTIFCQAAVFTTSIAAFKAFRPIPFSVSYTAGLSLGEYSALVASESIRFEDALRIVQKRAELMEEASQKWQR